MPMLKLDGVGLTVAALVDAATGHSQIELTESGLARMRQSRKLIDHVIDQRIPVYGVTTGLGARSSEPLDAEALEAFSVQTLRGRAQAMGPSAPVETVRAAMIVRVNTMLSGHSGAQPHVAEHIVACLNANLTPVVGNVGSIGAADLTLNATLGLALIGEGMMQDASGDIGPSAEKMRANGIEPLKVGPRDGLALANHTAFSAGAGALALAAAQTAFEVSQTAAAMSLEGFRANLTPLKLKVLAAKPLPGQAMASTGLHARLQGSRLWNECEARRLQDPLSFRNICQIHGTMIGTLEHARTVIEVEMNGSSDNPVALLESEEIISCGNYYTSEFSHAIEGVSRAAVQLSMAQIARFAKMLTPTFSGLSTFLAHEDSGSNGFAPVMKSAEAWLGKLLHAAQPVPIWPSINANGVEDCLPNTPQAISALDLVVYSWRYLNALELLIAAQAIELRGRQETLAPFVQKTLKEVRKQAAFLDTDRAVGPDVEKLVGVISHRRSVFTDL